jgi:hypothetical protein
MSRNSEPAVSPTPQRRGPMLKSMFTILKRRGRETVERAKEIGSGMRRDLEIFAEELDSTKEPDRSSVEPAPSPATGETATAVQIVHLGVSATSPLTACGGIKNAGSRSLQITEVTCERCLDGMSAAARAGVATPDIAPDQRAKEDAPSKDHPLLVHWLIGPNVTACGTSHQAPSRRSTVQIAEVTCKECLDEENRLPLVHWSTGPDETACGTSHRTGGSRSPLSGDVTCEDCIAELEAIRDKLVRAHGAATRAVTSDDVAPAAFSTKITPDRVRAAVLSDVAVPARQEPDLYTTNKIALEALNRSHESAAAAARAQTFFRDGDQPGVVQNAIQARNAGAARRVGLAELPMGTLGDIEAIRRTIARELVDIRPSDPGLDARACRGHLVRGRQLLATAQAVLATVVASSSTEGILLPDGHVALLVGAGGPGETTVDQQFICVGVRLPEGYAGDVDVCVLGEEIQFSLLSSVDNPTLQYRFFPEPILVTADVRLAIVPKTARLFGRLCAR